MTAPEPGTLVTDLRDLLNRNSAENASNTPDFILASYLLDCLTAYERAVKARDGWYMAAEGYPAEPAPPAVPS